MPPLPPTVDDVAAYLGVPPTTAGLDAAVAAAIEIQAATNVVDPYTDALRLAATRRAARTFASQNHPLGTVDAGDFGTLRLTRWDAEIESLESPYRLPPFAGPFATAPDAG